MPQDRLGVFSLPAKLRLFFFFYEFNLTETSVVQINLKGDEGRHLLLFSKSAKELKSVGSRRQMSLTVEKQRVEQEEAPNEWMLLVSKPKKSPTKKGSWSG